MHSLSVTIDVQGYNWFRLEKWGQTRIDARCSCGHIFYVGWSASFEPWQEVFEAILVAYPIHARSEK